MTFELFIIHYCVLKLKYLFASYLFRAWNTTRKHSRVNGTLQLRGEVQILKIKVCIVHRMAEIYFGIFETQLFDSANYFSLFLFCLFVFLFVIFFLGGGGGGGKEGIPKVTKYHRV